MSAISNHSVLEDGYYSLEDFDNIVGLKCVQVTLLVFALVVVCVADSIILRTIYLNKNLHCAGNVILSSILINDLLNVLQFSVTSTLMFALGKVWLNNSISKTLAIFVQLPRSMQAVLFAIGATEKLFYCIYPFKHTRIFTMRKTIYYIVIFHTIVVITTVVDVLHREIVFIPSLLTCLGTIQSRDKSENPVIVVLRYCFVVIPGSWTLWTHIITFVFSIKKRGSLQSDPKIIRRRLFLSFLTLFAASIVDSIGRIWRLLIIQINDIPSLIGRIGIVYYIFAPAVANPLIIMLGNRPIRKSIRNKKTMPVWLEEIQYSNQQQRNLQNCSANIINSERLIFTVSKIDWETGINK